MIETVRMSMLATVLAVGMTPSAAHAWGRDGHQIICDLAYRHLTEEARSEVDRLVDQDERFDHFREICTWADWARSATHRYTAPWHYTNQEPGDAVINRGDCAENGCILSAIELHGAAFSNPGNSNAARFEALMFLAHWVGDIHQPLHVSIAGDRGGNDMRLVWRGERASNLHRVWDSEIILDYMSATWPETEEGMRWRAMSRELAAELPLAGVTVYASVDPVAWAQESHDIVRSDAFGYYAQGYEVMGDPDDAYYERSLPTVRQRLKLGGVRLAGVINALLDENALADAAVVPETATLP